MVRAFRFEKGGGRKMTYIIRFGTSVRVFHTPYHVKQFTRALNLNGTAYTLEQKAK